jgi:uncharacterized protein
MKKTLLFALVLLTAVAAPAIAQSYFPVTQIPTVQVSGEIRTGVAEAKAEVDRKALQVQEMLVTMGIDRNRINASEILIGRVDPISREQGSQKKETFQVSRQISVTIEEISRLDAVLDRAVSLETNEVTQVALYSSREKELKLKALRLATGDARRKAETLAGEFKRVLGNVYMAEHEFGGGGPVFRMALQEQGPSPQFFRGTIRIDARVAVVYEMQ